MIISMNLIRMDGARLVNASFSSAKRRGHSSLFTYQRMLRIAPEMSTFDSCAMRAPFTTTTSVRTTERREKREDFTRTKFDYAFSSWKILTGPSDWKNHAMGIEGAEKYRTQNLPNTCNNDPGCYELGIAISVTRGSHRKLSSHYVIVVYIGQAENVRTRLQQYGRDGAHLEKGFRNEGYNNRPGLFSDIFSRGCAIAYRWAPMKTKKDAEKFEDELLKLYDYAWNKRRNGDRRPHDIHKKLEPYTRKSPFSQLLNTTLQYLKRTNVRCDYSTRICGVKMGNIGSVCTNPPVDGRKRCADHKWMKVNNGLISKFKIEEKEVYEKLCSNYLWSCLGKWFFGLK